MKRFIFRALLIIIAIFTLPMMRYIFIKSNDLQAQKPERERNNSDIYEVTRFEGSKLRAGSIVVLCDPQRGNLIYLRQYGDNLMVVHQPDACN